ncbi:MAG: tetratricopeptide repeat protein [Proteobacteria bacterium]|nr:tetratricopeptide repeat protein [Pseudomonadota bacterium]
MIDTFPVLSSYRGLITHDFFRFSQSFAEILKKCLPTAQKVYFSNVAGQFTDYPGDKQLPADWVALFEAMRKGGKTVAIHAQSLMLLFAARDGKPVVALVEGADPVFLGKVGEDWLEETRAAAERQFILLKEARVDVQTGLLNLWNLYSLLDSSRQSAGLHLILVELPPKRMSFRYTVRYSQKCATLILNFIQGDSVLHTIGQSTFALVLPNRQREYKSEVESALVAYLKREGCHKVHIGSSCSRAEDRENNMGPRERNLLNEAWTALHHAEKRGPFSFCDYNLLAHPENHPLIPPKGNLVRRLSRLWRQSLVFSLVHFQCKSAVNNAKDIVLPLLDRGVCIATDKDVLVYLDDFDAAAALSWAREVLHLAGDATTGSQVSAGVSSYPCGDFKKTEMLFNCRKALLHASFFDYSTAVIFDSVSLNISGDIYFGDGDLAKAIREFKRGLKIDKENVNLHNSLGVALAMMDRLAPAMMCFENALAIDNQNFMAFYNLGLAEKAQGKKPEAYKYLEKALLHYSDEDGGSSLLDDLKLQMGMLAGDLDKHLQALDFLKAWQTKNEKVQRAGRALYHIGKAHHGTGDNRQAMVELQRALQFNEFDDRAMNLLGIIYFREGEGDEIALALCRKSVELEPGNILYRSNLAEVQLQCGLLIEARENLYRCLKDKKTRAKAQVLLGRSYVREGLPVRAKSWFEKALKQDDVLPEFYEEAKRGVRKV